MADKNKSTLIAGISLIVVSFFCVAVLVYFMGRANKQNSEKLGSLEVQLANLMIEKAENEMSADDYARVKRPKIDTEDFMAKAESIYGEDELKRKEGVFWIDRKVSVCMVTLGKVNGVESGTSLNLYDGDTLVGKAVVDTTFDIVSYVKPVGKPIKDFDKSYYRAVNDSGRL